MENNQEKSIKVNKKAHKRLAVKKAEWECKNLSDTIEVLLDKNEQKEVNPNGGEK